MLTFWLEILLNLTKKTDKNLRWSSNELNSFLPISSRRGKLFKSVFIKHMYHLKILHNMSAFYILCLFVCLMNRISCMQILIKIKKVCGTTLSSRIITIMIIIDKFQISQTQVHQYKIFISQDLQELKDVKKGR